jgi:hypothetical protein
MIKKSSFNKKLLSSVFCVVSGLSLAPFAVRADSKTELEALKKKMAELEETIKIEQEKTNVLAGEVADSKTRRLIPEKKELKSEYGFGPSASSVYQVDQGLSLAGYGEAYYQNYIDDANGKRDQSDSLRTVGYFGYRFNDWILMNSEIEFEHGSTEGGASGEEGSVSVEFSYLDFFLDPAANIRAGLLLVPMGFLNEIHEPAYFHGVQRPELERYLIPTTWREMGLGLFGKIGDDVEYRSYLINGLRANSYSSEGIRDARQSGAEAITEDVAWVSRLDYTPTEEVPGLMLGSAFYIGNAGQDDLFIDDSVNARTTMLEGHAQYKNSGLELRALGVWTSIGDSEKLSQALNTTVGERQYGWYTEAAYDVLPLFGNPEGHYLAPFVRYERLDTQASVPDGFAADSAQNRKVYSVGLTYKPISQVAIKAEYRGFTSAGEVDPADSVFLGMGFSL